jgi:hypothetical protein
MGLRMISTGIPFCRFRLPQMRWDMLESMSHTLLPLVPRSATADAVSAPEDADECALSLQVRELGCTQRRIRKLSLGNRKRCRDNARIYPDRVLKCGCPTPADWPWVTHSRWGPHGELLTAAEMILITPLVDLTPVSGLAVKSRFTDNVRSPL